MYLFVEPLDVLLFRECKPFSAGEIHRAAGVFPPTPRPFQGAIRTAILTHEGIDFEELGDPGQSSPEAREVIELIGGPGDYGQLCIKGPLLARCEDEGVETFFPMPGHGKLIKEEEKEFVFDLAPLSDRRRRAFPSGYSVNDAGYGKLRPLGRTEIEGEAEAAQKFLLTSKGLLSALRNRSRVSTTLAAERGALFLSEARLGIELDKGRRAAALGKLYTAEFTRMREEAGFLLDVGLQGDEKRDLLPEEGLLALGGERRGARYRDVALDRLPDHDRLTSARGIDIQDGRFLLYLATPAIFRPEQMGEVAWLPSWINAGSLEGSYNGVEFEVVSAAVHKSVPVGGWDLQKGRPKPLVRAVPAGSVYFCELKEGSEDEVKREFHNRTISELGGEIGFGLTFVGRWNYV